jgi:hypothetical protein
MSLRRSWVKSVVLLRRACVACNHMYLSGERSVRDIAVTVGGSTPIMPLPRGFHWEVGGNNEAYGPGRGIESLSESPAAVTMWRRSLCGRRDWWAGDASGVRLRVSLLGNGGDECVGLLLRSVCAD